MVVINNLICQFFTCDWHVNTKFSSYCEIMYSNQNFLSISMRVREHYSYKRIICNVSGKFTCQLKSENRTLMQFDRFSAISSQSLGITFQLPQRNWNVNTCDKIVSFIIYIANSNLAITIIGIFLSQPIHEHRPSRDRLNGILHVSNYTSWN